MSVDLGTLPAQLAEAVRAVRLRRTEVPTKPFAFERPDPEIEAWAKHVMASGDLDAAIAEVEAAEPELRS